MQKKEFEGKWVKTQKGRKREGRKTRKDGMKRKVTTERESKVKKEEGGKARSKGRQGGGL